MHRRNKNRGPEAVLLIHQFRFHFRFLPAEEHLINFLLNYICLDTCINIVLPLSCPRLMLISKLLDGHSIHCWLDRVNSAPTSVSRPSSLLKQQQFHFHSLPCPGYCFCTRRRTLRVVLVSVSRLCSWPIMSPIYPKNSVSNCVLHCWQNLVQQFGR